MPKGVYLRTETHKQALREQFETVRKSYLPGEKHRNWGKFTSTSKGGGHRRAHRRFKLDLCERCGKPATDRHHIDDNPLNNAPENIACLCRRCHMTKDGRIAKMRERNRSEIARSRPRGKVNWTPEMRIAHGEKMRIAKANHPRDPKTGCFASKMNGA